MKSRANHWLSMADPAWKIEYIPSTVCCFANNGKYVKVTSPCNSKFEFGIGDNQKYGGFVAITHYHKGENLVASDLVCEFLGLKTNPWWL